MIWQYRLKKYQMIYPWASPTLSTLRKMNGYTWIPTMISVVFLYRYHSRYTNRWRFSWSVTSVISVTYNCRLSHEIVNVLTTSQCSIAPKPQINVSLDFSFLKSKLFHKWYIAWTRLSYRIPQSKFFQPKSLSAKNCQTLQWRSEKSEGGFLCQLNAHRRSSFGAFIWYFRKVNNAGYTTYIFFFAESVAESK
jgi:hypothetical protein